MLVGGLLLLGLVVVLTQMPGGNTGTPGSQEMVDTKGEMGIAADASAGPSLLTALRAGKMHYCLYMEI